MLGIFNNLQPFFNDVYIEFGVREYAKLIRVSPPTASVILKQFERESLLVSRQYRNLLLFRANRESALFIDLNTAYFRKKLLPLAQHISEKTTFSTVVLFGSLAKCEQTINSDIDLFVDATRRDIALDTFEKTLKRDVQLHFKDVLKNVQLRKNIENGILLSGETRLWTGLHAKTKDL